VADGEHLVLGIDIGGTKAVAALARAGGSPPGSSLEIVAECRLERWARGGWEPDVAALLEAVSELLRGAGTPARELDAVGISAPGPLDPATGTVISAPNLPGWAQVPLGERFGRALGAPVRVENDANAAALAEWKHGAGRGTRHLVYVTMSTGVGAGLILDGRLYRGAHFQAGELGHVPIRRSGRLSASGLPGVLEAYTGGAALAAHIREDLRAGARSAIMELAGGDPERISAREWVAAIRAGDAYAEQLRGEFVQDLAQALAGTVMLLDPEIIVLGTIVQQNPDLFLGDLREHVRARLWQSLRDVRIEAGELGARLPAYAALSVATLEP
jgi:glucokinase